MMTPGEDAEANAADSENSRTSQPLSLLERDAKNLRFELLRNALYHSDELWYYSLIERGILYLSTLAGTAVVGSIYVQYQMVAFACGFLVTMLSTSALVFGFSARARVHEALRQRYFGMLADFESQVPAAETIIRIKSEMMRVWGQEPPIKWAINALATNSARSAMTPPQKLRKADLIPITGWQRRLRFIRPYSPEDFRPRTQQLT